MTWKKTWFNYLLWAIFIAASVFFLTLGVKDLLSYAFAIEENYIVIIGVWVSVLLAAGLFFVTEKLACHFEKKPAKRWISNTLLWIVVIASLFAGVYLRYFYIYHSVFESTLLESTCITDAFIGGNGYFFTGDFTQFAYSAILFGVFSFVGNKAIIAVFVQLFLQLIGYSFGALTVKKLTNTYGGVITWLLYLLLLGQVAFSAYFDTFWLFFAIFNIVMFLLVSFVFAIKDSTKKAFGIIGSVLLGFSIGFLVYANFYGIILVGFSLIIPFVIKKEEVEKKYFLIDCSLLLVMETLTYFTLTYFMGWQSGLQYFESFGILYKFTYDTAILGLILCLGIFTFFSRSKSEYIMPGLVMFVITMILWYVPVYKFNSDVVLYTSVIIAAGIVAAPSFMPRERNIAEEETGEEAIVDISSEILEATEPSESKVKLIDNPFAQPKKHVAKTIDYDHQFSDDELMDYDIKVSDDDDYDLK